MDRASVEDICEADTAKARPAPSTPEVGVLDKKASWVERRLEGKKVRLSWKFAGSSNVHEGVCEGIVEHSKGKSVMLTLDEKTVERRRWLGNKTESHRGVTNEIPVFDAPDYITVTPPLFVPLRAVLSIEAIP